MEAYHKKSPEGKGLKVGGPPAAVGLPPQEMVLRWLPLEAGVGMESCRGVASGVVLSGAAAGGGGGAMRGVFGMLAFCAHVVTSVEFCSDKQKHCRLRMQYFGCNYKSLCNTWPQLPVQGSRQPIC